ncbi:hypothetical protein C8J57DRAFT_1303401, partial [Mycena rebaudengoi]
PHPRVNGIPHATSCHLLALFLSFIQCIKVSSIPPHVISGFLERLPGLHGVNGEKFSLSSFASPILASSRGRSSRNLRFTVMATSYF